MPIDWTINISNIVLVAMALGGIVATWAVLQSKVSALEKRAADEETDRAAGDDKLGTSIASANAQFLLVSQQLAEHKLHVAETYITKAGLREFRDEVMTGVRELKGSVSTIHERIDQIILAEKAGKRS